MTAILGLSTKVSVGMQPSFATPTTLARKSLQVYSLTGGATQSDEDDNILGGELNNPYDPTEPAPGLDDHAISFKVPIDTVQFGWWLAAFFGAAVTDDTDDPDFIHNFSSGVAPSPIFIEHLIKTGLYRRHVGLIGKSMEIDWSAEAAGYAMASFTFVGMNEVPQTTALTGAITAAPTLSRPPQKLVKITYDSVAGGDLVSGKVSIDRKLKRIRSADGSGIPTSIEFDGSSTVGGSLSTRFEDDSFYEDARTQVQVPLSFELFLAGSTTRGVGIDFGLARLDRMPVDVPDTAALQYNPNFRAWQTPSAPAMTCRVHNDSETLAFA